MIIHTILKTLSKILILYSILLSTSIFAGGDGDAGNEQNNLTGKCVKVGQDCIEPGGNRVINGHNIYRDCWRYKDAYRCSGFAKNTCSEFAHASYCNEESQECKANVGFWCVARNRKYKCETEENFTRKEKRYRIPSFKKNNIDERKRIKCKKSNSCIDGSCFDSSYQSNNEMAKAAGMLRSLKETQGKFGKEFDIKSNNIFKGDSRGCASRVFGLNKCCRPESEESFLSKIGLSICDDGAREIHRLKQAGRCHYVGSWEEELFGIFSGWRKHHAFCCFESKVAKEINVQARVKGLVKKSFGNPESPNCSGFTMEELQSINFEKIDLGFLAEEIKEKNLWSKMGSMKDAMQHTSNLLEGELKSIKEDMQNKGSSTRSDTNNKDIHHHIDQQQLFEKKFNEKHDNPASQKKPDGMDKQRDIKEQTQVIYNKQNYQNRDEKGL